MKKIYILYLALLLVVSFSGGYFLHRWTSGQDNNIQGGSGLDNKNSGIVSPNNNTPDKNPEGETDPIKNQISKMSPEEKIGQLMIVGIDGYDVDKSCKSMLEEYHVGGFIILKSNIKSSSQLLTLVNSLKAANSKNNIPLFLSIDQEGGRIDRMTDELKRYPSNKSIGEKNNEKLSFDIGASLAYEIKAFGFNMNFAPVLDINSNTKNPVIGDRSFGSNASIVSKLGIETMKGIRSEKVIPVVKHFPGHGDTSVDSHIGLPKVGNDLNRLKNLELAPFAAAIKNGAEVVMIAHILLPKIDAENPASFSKTIITDILREQMNYNGVVITDDMTMGAITKNYDVGSAAVKSINAGSDIILVAHEYDVEVSIMKALKKALENGTISSQRLDESVYRILKLKSKYSLKDEIIQSINLADINKRISSVLDPYYK